MDHVRREERRVVPVEARASARPIAYGEWSSARALATTLLDTRDEMHGEWSRISMAEKKREVMD